MIVGVNWLTLYQECGREVFWAVIVPPVHFGVFFCILENKLIGYADDSTLMAVVPSSTGVRGTVAESLYRDSSYASLHARTPSIQ